VNIYRRDGAKVFQKWSWLNLDKYGLFHPKYTNEGLKGLLQQNLGDKVLADASTLVGLTSCYFRSSTQPTGFFITNTKAETNDIKFIDACVATSAAPTYFPSYKFDCGTPAHDAYDNYQWVDGGVVANNPAVLCFAEAASLVDNPKLDILHVSLGTGYDPGYLDSDEAASKIDIDGATFWASSGLSSVGITGTQALTSICMK
jgi:patatin-like phospholipase/acyl hydrolase